MAVEVVQLGDGFTILLCSTRILCLRGTIHNDRVTHTREGKECDGGESVSYHLYIPGTTS